MNLPPPDQLPDNMTDAQKRAVILHGIVNPNYPDEADEVLSFEIVEPGHLKTRVRDGKKIIDFEIEGDEVTFGLADDSPDGGEFSEASPDTVALFVERLTQKARPQVAAMVETVRSLLDSSADIMEFNEKLQDAYPDLNGDALVGTMAEALYASRLAGIFEAESGT